MENDALKIENLKKSFGGLTAVNGISFSVRRGSLFAFLGSNGAGKSTTINMICSILNKDEGKIYVGGYDLDVDRAQIKREIGVVFQSSVLDRGLTVRQNLEIRSSFYGLSRAERRQSLEEIVSLLELEPIYSRQTGTLSGGQLRRVDIARAMIHRPNLLILDEPTTGLDPKTRLAVWSLIDGIRSKAQMTVFLTTHYLEEADQASDVVIMDRGSVIAHGSPNELKNAYSKDRLLCYREKSVRLERGLEGENVDFSYDDERGVYEIVIRDTAQAKKLLSVFDKELTDVEIRKGNMDDVFLNIAGRSISGDGE